MNKTNKNIPATLDLNKSLENFEFTITSALELTNIAEWDGRTLKHTEEKIREAALILAGQCVALLIHNISHERVSAKNSN